MLQVFRTNSFKKDLKRLKRQNKNLEKLITVIGFLVNNEILDKKYRDHILIGNYKGFRECHIEPDWLLIYRIDENSITLTRTGSHNELF